MKIILCLVHKIGDLIILFDFIFLLVLCISALIFFILAVSSFFVPNLGFSRGVGGLVLLLSLPVLFIVNIQELDEGIAMFNGLFISYWGNSYIESFLFLIGGILILSVADDALSFFKKEGSSFLKIAKEYGLISMLSLVGISMLISISDMLSLYLSIELQSFAVYILAGFYRNSEPATSAGLKYFLLGAMSSAFILLGAATVYSFTGVTNMDGLIALITIWPEGNDVRIEFGTIIGLYFVLVGLLFKVAAAPFHQWAPDVYNGAPTIVTTWLTVIPKISVLIALLTLSVLAYTIEAGNVWKLCLMFCSMLSLVLGTVSGLNQTYIKRLLSFSTVAHVGFILLALSLYTEQSLFSYTFYIIQYSLTNGVAFLILLVLGVVNRKTDVDFISQLKGWFSNNPLLCFSFGLVMFSMAGVPPLIGFWGKYYVISSSVECANYFIALVAILTSVISASYYLQIICVSFFDLTMPEEFLYSLKGKEEKQSIVNKNTLLHSEKIDNNGTYSNEQVYANGLLKEEDSLYTIHYFVSVLMLCLLLYMLNPNILVSPIHLISLSIFNT